MLGSEDGGLRTAMNTPSRSLLLRTDAGPDVGTVVLGVLISTAAGDPLAPGARFVNARFDFWVDLAEIYLGPGQEFELCYPNRVVARGLLTSVFPVESA
jgi:hypothetical protein